MKKLCFQNFADRMNDFLPIVKRCRLILHGRKQGGKINEQKQITERQETSASLCETIALLLTARIIKLMTILGILLT